MTRPQHYLTRMALFLGVVAVVAALLSAPLMQAFLGSPVLNGLIVGVLLTGVVYTSRQVWLLGREVAWVEAFRTAPAGETIVATTRPALLAPLARMLGERRGRVSFSAISMRTVLDGVAGRLDESRELSRYLVGLLILLGLLGTFWGLLHTVRSVGGVIGGLTLDGRDLTITLGNLQHGLEAPLSGMGQAFSASLFGLAGSLVLGFLELQATQAQSRFLMELEDWLSGAARLSSHVGGADGEASVPAYLQALLEQMAENLDTLQRTLAQGEEGRRVSNHNVLALTERLSILTDQMRAEQALMFKLAESQSELKPVLTRLADAASAGSFGIDEASRQHIRNVEVYLARILEDLTVGRAQGVQEIRSEIKMLARTIAALAEDVEPR